MKTDSMKLLGWVTLAFTFLLMVWGNLVSATGSGLACPDWPLCHGTIAPPLSTPVVLEWGHRLLAAGATILIVLTLVQALRPSAQPRFRRPGIFLVGLLATQIGLGGATVLMGLSVTLSTIHLLIAHLVLGGLIALALALGTEEPVVSRSAPRVRTLALFGVGVALVQLTFGAILRHGKLGMACPNFPSCLEYLLPIPFVSATFAAFFHRWWGALLFVLLGVLAKRSVEHSRALAIPAIVALVLAAVQIPLGAMTVLSGLDTELRAAHAAVGYGLWGALFAVAVRAGSLPFLLGSRSKQREKGLGLVSG